MNSNNETAVQYQKNHITNWDNIAKKRDTWSSWGKFYHRRIDEIHHFLISPGQRVLEIGCGMGDLLVSLQPPRGVGVDFSPEMIQRARARHAALDALEWIEMDAHDLSSVHGPFDAIILSDLVNDLWDVQGVFQQVRALCDSHTRLILKFLQRTLAISPRSCAAFKSSRADARSKLAHSRGCFQYARFIRL